MLHPVVGKGLQLKAPDLPRSIPDSAGWVGPAGGGRRAAQGTGA
jgi:hypothetical protein